MEPIEFLKTIFGENTGYLCIVTKDDNANLTQQKFISYPANIKTLEKYLAVREDEDVYFSPMLYAVPNRSSRSVSFMPVVYADTDTFNPENYLVTPTLNVNTGEPGGITHRHSYWLLDDIYPPEQVEAAARAIAQTHAYKVNGEQAGVDPSGWDRSQLLRVPGSINAKGTDRRSKDFEKFQGRGYTQDYPVFVEGGSAASYSLAEITAAYDPANLPAIVLKADTPMPTDLPDIKDVLRKITAVPRLAKLYAHEPRGNQDWSDLMYSFVSELLRSGFTAEETLVVAWQAPYNKYKRDGRPLEHLWQYDIVAATNDPENKPRPKTERVATDDVAPQPKKAGEFSLELEKIMVPDNERHLISPTFVDEYLAWARTKTDAPEVFHVASAMTILSCIFGEWGELDPQWGRTPLGLYYVILAETTESRKTTARNMMKDILRHTQIGNYDYILTSNATEEALNEALADRPHQSSMFDQDEVQNLVVAVKGGKSYMKGFLEYLNKLYDGWSEGRLRKGLKTPDTPVNFIQYLMGIRSQFQDNLELSDFASGWGPRNFYVMAEHEPKTREASRPKQGSGGRVDTVKMGLIRKLTDARNFWANKGDSSRDSPSTIMFTEEAWVRVTDVEWDLKEHFEEHPRFDILSACFVRFGINVMKVAALLAMYEQREVVELKDVVNARYLAIDWAKNLIRMVEGVAATLQQRELDALEQYIVDNDGLVTWAKTLKWGTRKGKSRKDLWELVTVLKESSIIEVLEDGAGRTSLGLL